MFKVFDHTHLDAPNLIPQPLHVFLKEDEVSAEKQTVQVLDRLLRCQSL